jgi:hypothetical protein
MRHDLNPHHLWSPNGSMIDFWTIFDGGAVDEWISVVSSNGGPPENLRLRSVTGQPGSRSRSSA